MFLDGGCCGNELAQMDEKEIKLSAIFFDFLRFCLQEDAAEPAGLAEMDWDALYDSLNTVPAGSRSLNGMEAVRLSGRPTVRPTRMPRNLRP